MKSKAGAAVLIGILALTAAGCGDDEVPQARPGAAKASVAEEPTSAPAGPTGEDLDTLFGALADLTPAKVDAALKVVSPGSVAELYLKHQAAVAQAYTDGGTPMPADDLTENDGAYTSCAEGESGDDCAVWADVTAEGDKIASFTTSGNPLDGRLLAGSKKRFRAGSMAEIQLLSAYVTSLGDLWITLDIKNTSSQSIALESRTAYRSKDGRQSDAGTQGGPTSLLPDSRATYALVVTGGKLGGTLHIEMYAEKGSSANGVTDIPIR